ncbi:MAG: hypothetical protein OZSIB_0058 [Candidatus Ozemobacter sibiricus]|uniref:Uncharacterized protein n=1 Tax=Candidatus Ozemobacter sibiricus TaxID=2268124 RepID=A0A367ZMR6_9BACT|nr:MAG: hypothetical protein OZSIB_0058 [Candidatus Ozemobacter sibiricus]
MGLAIMMILGAVGVRLIQHLSLSQRTFSQQVQLQLEARRAFDQTMALIREGTDLVRPVLGETLPYLIFKDITNRVTILYLEPNDPLAQRLKVPVYRLLAYRTDYSGAYNASNEKVLLESVRSLSFTSLSPNSVQVNVTVVQDRNEFQFLGHIGLMNLGGLR